MLEHLTQITQSNYVKQNADFGMPKRTQQYNGNESQTNHHMANQSTLDQFKGSQAGGKSNSISGTVTETHDVNDNMLNYAQKS